MTATDHPIPEGAPQTAPQADAGSDHDERMAHWAEHDMTLAQDSTTALHGPAASAHGRRVLLEALGSEHAVQQAVRGRKTLGRNQPAGRSPKRQTTLPADLDARSRAFIATGGAPDFSALIRDALGEYLDHHATT